MRRSADVLVLGGGPAGAATALLLARQGVRVTLLERDRFPRHKVCGEFVSAEGCAVLRRLAVFGELQTAGGRRMQDCRITSLGGRVFEAPLPELPAGRDALGVTRAALDGLLLATAAREGVDVRERWEYLEPRLEDGRVRGVVARPVGAERREDLDAALVIAADGRRSRLARALHSCPGDPRRSSPGSWFGHKVHLDSGAVDAAGCVELHLFPGGYAGIAPVEGGRLNLCLLARVATLRQSGSLDRLLEQRVMANPAARATLDGTRVCGRWQSIGPLRFAPRRPEASGALFVGDAAGTIDPFTGDGISHALLAAELVLPFALAACSAGGLSAGEARRYARSWHAAFDGVTRRSRWLGRLFERPRAAGPLLGLIGRLGGSHASRIVSLTRTGLAALPRNPGPEGDVR